jgi:hypothetical protein
MRAQTQAEHSRDISSWTEFETVIQELNRYRDDFNRNDGPQLREPLYRGVAKYAWGLQTTLERSYPIECPSDVKSIKD